ncbi:methionine--tRNA ligase [Patescibacteria group bacterium]|jgi:methionyl-tRNA synthetase|nr:methionine--tRNA ligase [Patescibacteria group bacterium]
MSYAGKGFYVTTPIYYPNAKLHMGHAYATTLCDILARYHRALGEPTYFLSGADENTQKVVQAAEAAGVTPQAYLEEIVAGFQHLYGELSISNDQFIRTTDQRAHWPGAQALWMRLVEAGDIYRATYRGLYCVGAESFVTEKDLRAGGLCPDHDEEPQVLEEDNYYFRLSRYTDTLRHKIETDELRILPASRKGEILALLREGLADISFSRPKEKVPMGIPVPHDESQVMYVWCDALTNYLSALGYGREDTTLFSQFWPADVHVVGKDILRFHAAIWPAMLLSAGLPLPRAILVHGMITSGGRKMSKSLGNVIDPLALVEEYGTEAVRYYLAREISPFEDGDITLESFHEAYNAQLANGLGNLTARIMTMAEKYLPAPRDTHHAFPERYQEAFADFDVKRAMDTAWAEVAELDRYIQETQPFKLVKIHREGGIAIIEELVDRLGHVAHLLTPFLPDTAARIKDAIARNAKPAEPLFERKELPAGGAAAPSGAEAS